MRAIDTNVVVRFLLGDDPEQAEAARTVIEAGDIFIPTTVLLESEWVLRSGYGCSPKQVAAALRRLSGLPGVIVEEPTRLIQALDWLDSGMDFADALHLAKSEGCTAFLSFDRKLRKAAQNCAVIPVIAP